MSNPSDNFRFNPDKLDELRPGFFLDPRKDDLIAARDRIESTGEDPSPREYYSLGDAAQSIEMDYLEKYSVQLDMSGPLLDIAASAHKKQFLMEELSPQEAKDLELVTEIADDIEQRQQGGAGIEDQGHRDALYVELFNRNFNELSKQYKAEMGSSGSSELMEVAAHHQSRQDVFGIQPNQEASALLDAAKNQRQKGTAELFQKEYVAAGLDRPRAKIAGEAKADAIFNFLEKDSQLSPEDLEAQEEALEWANLHQTGRDAVVNRAKGEVDKYHLLSNAQKFMDNAREAGITASSGDTTSIQGNNYSIVQQRDTTVIQGDGKKLIADGDDVLKIEGFEPEDFDRFERLVQRSADDLRKVAAINTQSEPRPQQRRPSTTKAIKQEVEV